MSKVIVKFHGGHFLLDNAPWSGRSVEVDRDQTETLIENNQCSISQETADILKISKSTKLLVKMINVPFILWKNHVAILADPTEQPTIVVFAA